ncbi:MAG TPA: hypothetical protein VG992_01310 [Candidatus Saccharimonadales bacterium]|nr:hypothetical protein [Candidatus Saccharimonadales bacterium]
MAKKSLRLEINTEAIGELHEEAEARREQRERVREQAARAALRRTNAFADALLELDPHNRNTSDNGYSTRYYLGRSHEQRSDPIKSSPLIVLQKKRVGGKNAYLVVEVQTTNHDEWSGDGERILSSTRDGYEMKFYNAVKSNSEDSYDRNYVGCTLDGTPLTGRECEDDDFRYVRYPSDTWEAMVPLIVDALADEKLNPRRSSVELPKILQD